MSSIRDRRAPECLTHGDASLSLASSCRHKTSGLLPALPARQVPPCTHCDRGSLSWHPVCTGSLFGALSCLSLSHANKALPRGAAGRSWERMQVVAGPWFVFCSAAALLFLESPTEGGKEHGCIPSVAQPGCVGSCFIPHQRNKGERRMAAGCRLPLEGPVEAVVCWGCSSSLENPPLRQGGNGKSRCGVNVGVFCHVCWLLGCLLSAIWHRENKQMRTTRGGHLITARRELLPQ